MKYNNFILIYLLIQYPSI